MKKTTTYLVILALSAFVSASALAQDPISQSRRNAIVQAIEKAAPAVVSVNVIQVEAQRVLDASSRDFWDLFSARPKVLLREKQIDSVGSGFFIDNEGHIVTNYHVVEGSDKVASVTLADGRIIDVELVGADKRTDIAVLHAKGERLPLIPLGDSNNLLIGEWSIAIGNPFGTLMKDPQPTVSVGVVSANHRRISPTVGEGERLYQDMIQTDAAINPGNSGGPLINANGEAIGVNTMIFSQSGGSVGLGFAIPINRVSRVAKEIIQFGHRRDPWPGFKVEDVADLGPELRQQLSLTTEVGCVVVNQLTSSPAYSAGLRPGDVIVSVNGQSIDSSVDIDFVFWNLFVGDMVNVEVDRSGARKALSFEIKELNQ
jgi:serine protease Do